MAVILQILRRVWKRGLKFFLLLLYVLQTSGAEREEHFLILTNVCKSTPSYARLGYGQIASSKYQCPFLHEAQTEEINLV